MFHLAAYSELIATAVENDLTPVPDSILTIQNGHFLPRRDCALIWAAAMGTNLQRARITTPSYRQYNRPWIRGIMPGLVPTSPQQLWPMFNQPLPLKGIEELAIDATQNAVANQQITAVVGLQFSPAPPAIGDIFTTRGTSVTVAVANAWTLLVPVFDDVLPAGRYAVCGFNCISTNGQAARLIFEDQSYRPGSLSTTALGNIQHPYFTKGVTGQWGTFNSYAMPNIEVLCNAADAAHEFYIDYVRL